MKFLAWIFFLISIMPVACKRNINTLTEEEVLSVIRRFDAGWETKNLQLVDSVLAPTYVYFTQSGGTFSREGVVETAGSDEYQLERMERSGYSVQITGNTALVSTRWQGKGIYRGVPFDEDQRCSIVLVKQNGRVSILSEHCTPIKHNKIFH